MSVNWEDYVYFSDSSKSLLRASKDRGRVKKGCEVGWKSHPGYWRVGINGKMYLVHRVIYEMLHGKIPDDKQVDHIDGDPSNNSPSNLRLVSRTENQRNMKKDKRNKSGIAGVSRCVVKNSRTGKENVYWVAYWRKVGGGYARQGFPVSKLGEDLAKSMAISKRIEEMEKLNELGFGYTSRHIYGE